MDKAAKNPFVKIWLKTENGALVTEKEIPEFTPAPQVIIWGDRVFKQSTHNNYIEVFAYCIPELAEKSRDEEAPPRPPKDKPYNKI